MEDPCLLPADLNQELVDKFKGPDVELYEFPHQFIMVSGYIYNFCILCYKSGQVADHHEVMLGEIAFSELPDVDNVSVKDQQFRMNAAEVYQQFFCMTAESSEVDIRDHHNIHRALWD